MKSIRIIYSFGAWALLSYLFYQIGRSSQKAEDVSRVSEAFRKNAFVTRAAVLRYEIPYDSIMYYSGYNAGAYEVRASLNK